MLKDESRLIFVSRDHRKIKEVKVSHWKLFLAFSLIFIVVFVVGKFGLDMIVDSSLNSEMKRLMRTNMMLQDRLQEMSNKVKMLNNQIAKIGVEDDQLRTVLGVPKLDSDTRKVGIGGSDYNYKFLDQVSGFDAKVDLSKQLQTISQLEREIKLEKESYKSLLQTFYKKQDSLQYLPALRPVLTGFMSSPFGMRFHPIYKVMRFHEGVDISTHLGTPVYATADGYVKFTGYNGGYGKMIILNHKYGFETRYAHLSKIVVRRGQFVKRGEKIGEVGNTGLSTAPHLHYEVLLHGKHLNPAHYFFNDQNLNQQVVSKVN